MTAIYQDCKLRTQQLMNRYGIDNGDDIYKEMVLACQATAARCVEICNQIDDDMPGCATAKRCAIDIKKEHGLE